MKSARAGVLGERVWKAAAIATLVGLPLLFADWRFLGQLDFAPLWTYRQVLLRGVGVTLLYVAGAAIVGYAAGTVLAITSRSAPRSLRMVAILYVEFWRNTPLLVQLFWIHFAAPFLTGIQTSIFVSGYIALAANVSAYFCEIVRAGIGAVPSGQWDAAQSLGLRPVLVWRLAILPQAFRMILPPATNLLIGILKASAILSVLGVNELMRLTGSLSTNTFRIVEFYTGTAVIYVALGLCIAALSSRVERWSRSSGSRHGL